MGASAALLNLWIRKTALCCRLLPRIISFFRKAFVHEYRKVLIIAQCCSQLLVTHLVILPSLAGHEMLNLNWSGLGPSYEYVTDKKKCMNCLKYLTEYAFLRALLKAFL